MVRHYENKSRRWKSHNTLDTPAPSAEKPLSNDKQWVFGRVDHARKQWLEELGLYREYQEGFLAIRREAR